jgi:3-oxoacyl-[acyl-carrier protein] reductase
MEFEGKVVIVTGSGRGIGKGIVEAFARSGAVVVVNDIDIDNANSVAEGLKRENRQAMVTKADISKSAEVDSMVSQVLAVYGRVDILVNNAGVFAQSVLISDISDDEWDRVLDTNLRGVFYCSRAVIRPMMTQKSGNIINITSFTGKTGRVVYAGFGEPTKAHYCTSKAGIISFTKSLAFELAPHSIRANAIAVGSMTAGPVDEERRKRLNRLVPLGRTGEPEDIYEAVLFLASEKSSFITGEILDVNGGTLMD